MRRNRLANIYRVAKFLEKNPDTYIREIARSLDMSPGTVHRVIKSIEEFVITRSVTEELRTSLPNLPIMIRLKPGVTAEGILRFLKFKERLSK